GEHVAVGIGRERNATAFAGLVDDLALGRKGGAAVGRNGVIHRRAVIRLFGCLRAQEVALVDPRDEDAAGAVDSNRIEAVRDRLAIVMDRDWRAPRLAAVERTRETHEARIRRIERARPAHIQRTVRAGDDLRAVLAVGIDRFGLQ
ncbi:hypothetical protein COLO4_01734, partial [Corchorus olitorius]